MASLTVQRGAPGRFRILFRFLRARSSFPRPVSSSFLSAVAALLPANVAVELPSAATGGSSPASSKSNRAYAASDAAGSRVKSAAMVRSSPQYDDSAKMRAFL